MKQISRIALPKSANQLDGRLVVRERFRLASQFLMPLHKLIQMGFATKMRGKTAMGMAMSYLIRYGIAGTYPNLTVNPAMALLSQGTLANPLGIQAFREGRQLQAIWMVERTLFSGYLDDGVILCAYHPESGVAGINELPSARQDGEAVLTLPTELADRPVHLYFLVHSRDKKQFSKSLYLGLF